MNTLKSIIAVLAVLAASSIAQTAPLSADDIRQGKHQENSPKSKYLVAFGKILAKKSGIGWTTFAYRDGPGSISSTTFGSNTVRGK